ncbi:MAG: hypothetical protein ABFD45_03890 [Smithella sp.]
MPISLNSGLSAIYTGITARVSVTVSAIRLKVAETTDIIIFHDVSFIAAGVQIFGILIVFFPQVAGVNQAHEHIADEGAMFGLEEKSVFPCDEINREGKIEASP